MTKLVVQGGIVVTPLEERLTDVWTDDGHVGGVGMFDSDNADSVIDARGCYVTPGLVDLQVNGGPPCDFWTEPSACEVEEFSRELLARGVTTILPTLITGDMEQTKRTRDFLREKCGAGTIAQRVNGMVRMPGIHLEGPFLSPARPGVHPPQFLQPLELSLVQELVDESVLLITLAPELDPSGQCIEWLKARGVKVALGHSNATYAEARTAFDRNVDLMTHTFNALPPLHHREPGAVGAALLDRRVTCCMICDGLHLSPAAAALIEQCKGVERTILVTDIAKVGTSQGGLVGASIYLCEAVRNCVEWGISSFSEAVRMASYNPAAKLALSKELGALIPGALADMVIWDARTLEIRHVIFNGKLVGASPAVHP